MGFLDFLFKPKVELPKQEPTYVEQNYPYSINTIDSDIPGTKPSRKEVKFEDNWYQSGVDPLPREYSDKGITFRENNKANPWQCYFSITKKIDGKHKTIQFHIGYFKTKEEAQKARWEFIENLK